jgi:hypothetical protein
MNDLDRYKLLYGPYRSPRRRLPAVPPAGPRSPAAPTAGTLAASTAAPAWPHVPTRTASVVWGGTWKRRLRIADQPFDGDLLSLKAGHDQRR